MSETLTIKNFGPIKSIELNLKQFNIIIGEQATGKSTIAKVLSVCRYLSYILPSDALHPNPFEEGLFAKGLAEFIREGTYIFYECAHYTFSAEYVVNNFDNYDVDGEIVNSEEYIFYTKLIPVSSEFIVLLKKIENIKPVSKGKFDLASLNWTIPTEFFLNEVAKIMSNPFYIYTERGLQSIFSLGKNSIQHISDSLYNHFAELDFISKLYKSETFIEPLNISYKNVDGKGFIKKNNEEKFYSLNNGASGYQSTIPIILVIEYYNVIRKKIKTFIVEEPELNLFPMAQQKLMEYLVDKTIKYGNSILVTTHSPYILTSLNNLMFAWQVGQNSNEEVEKILERKYWLNPENVSAYMMLPNGECESIIDREGLIKTEKIDSVSGLLNKEFNEMFDIELAIKK